jgi:hypothetical protein
LTATLPSIVLVRSAHHWDRRVPNRTFGAKWVPSFENCEELYGNEKVVAACIRRTPGPTASRAVVGEVPDGLGRSDWNSIRAEYERHRHAAFPVEGGHRARNFGQQWISEFDVRGFLVTPDSSDWKWGLELQSYGCLFEGSIPCHSEMSEDPYQHC